jgi:hypothetical protein
VSNKIQEMSLVEKILENRLSNLENLHLELQSQVDFNPFLSAISKDIAVKSKLSRSLTAKLGNKFALIARDLCVNRFGSENVPQIIAKDSIKLNLSSSNFHHQDTLIYTDINRDELLNESSKLIRFAGQNGNQIGSKNFRNQYEKSLTYLTSLNSVEPWTTQVDLYVNDATLGFCELESGGELDSSNVTAQPAKLIRAGLALGHVDKKLFFCLAYANKGEGNPIKGGLPKYISYAELSEEQEGLLVGKKWWEKILPTSITFDNFLILFSKVAVKLNIAG